MIQQRAKAIISRSRTLHRNRVEKNKGFSDGGRALYQYEDVTHTGNNTGLLELS